MSRLIAVLVKHSKIHGVNTTIELLRISNIAVKELNIIYINNNNIKRIEKLTNVSKHKLWQRSEGVEDRLAFCKAVITYLHIWQTTTGI